jgi:hypothetical protein
MINFFDDKRFSDITVAYSTHKISAHRIILAIRSSYLQKLLESTPTVSCFIYSLGSNELTWIDFGD